jgi:hypothetical protein
MRILSVGTKRSSTRFSEFFRSASSRDKKKVYAEVLERATKRQLDEIESARVLNDQKLSKA